MKRTSGMSYMEIVVATALFAILLAGALAVLAQTARGLTFAQDAYEAHLKAQRVLHIAREIYPAIPAIAGATVEHVRPFVTGFPANINHTGIVVLVTNEHGHATGRAVGMVIHNEID
jgi:type II secretory pathway pseudopilin PulG